VPPAVLRGVKVAHLSLSDGPGGAERMLALLADELQRGGCSTVAFLPAHGEGWLRRELDAAGVPTETFRWERPVSGRLARDLTAAFRAHRITVAHSHEFTMAVYGAWAAWRAGARHVITLHGSRYYADRLRRRVALRAAIAMSDDVVTVSRDLSRRLSRDLWIPPRRITTIPNGVQFTPTAHSTLRAELGLPPEERLLLAIGNLYPVKGHRHLVEALALLRRRGIAVHAAIAGRGERAGDLTARAAALGVGDRLHLLGLRSDIANLLAGADVFVLPSLAEGLPLALLEAMSAGLPIVASDVGDVRIALEGGGAGLVVPPGDAPAFAEAIAQLLTDRGTAQRLGTRAARRAVAEYGSGRMADRYAGLYTRALARGRSGAASVA
jgi:glycosyltransferase involved in cell wall biosynthesis